MHSNGVLYSSNILKLLVLIAVIVIIVRGIFLFKNMGYWINRNKLPNNSLLVRIDEYGMFKVMKKQKFFVFSSDRMLYLDSGVFQIKLTTCQFITKELARFHVNINALIQIKDDEKSILDLAYTKKFGQSYQDHIISSSSFKNNKKMVEGKLSAFIANKTFEEVNPATNKDVFINMMNDLFIQNFMINVVNDLSIESFRVVKVTDIEVII
jgi:uncharacterized membrane protein YqiK